MRSELERMIRALNQRRQYAPWFETSDKTRKELRVVQELVESLAKSGHPRFFHPRINRPDPPDCTCEDEAGLRVGIEVTEVVCSQAAAQNAQGRSVYRIWKAGELTDYVNAALRQKDAKCFNGSYSQIIVCAFTDEPTLTFESAQQELCSTRFGPFRQITSAFLLFSYVPSAGYPVVELQITSR